MKIGKRKKGDVLILDLQGKILIGEGIEELRGSLDNAGKENECQRKPD